MAPIASTVDMALSHVDGISDSTRARELYKYYQPSTPQPRESSSEDSTPQIDVNIKSDVTSSKISSPDTALTSFCQLTTWRTGAQRAMISLIDAKTQYFIAESTPTVDLVDNTKHAPGDEIWMGCASVSKAGRLCERTISAASTKPGHYPCFVVDDLTKDEKFNTLPFVTGPPYLRFYAGVPLITKRGIPIGSLFVVDDRIGNGMPDDKVHFMGTMANTIMRHMEMVREVEQHRRGQKMSRALASFVEGRSELAEAEADADDSEGVKVAGQFETESSIVRVRSKGSVGGSYSSTQSGQRESDYSSALSKTERLIMDGRDLSESPGQRPDLESSSHPTSFGGTSVSVSSPQVSMDKTSPDAENELSEISAMEILFARSATLIREGFELEGGVIFYDTQTGFSSTVSRESTGTADEGDDSFPGNSESEEKPDAPPLGDRTYSRTTTEEHKLAEVLSFSTNKAASSNGDPLPEPQSFQRLPEAALHKLLQRYPRGKLWTFDSDGAMSSSSDDDKLKPQPEPTREKDPAKRSAQNKKSKSEAKYLASHFPGVRQLLFIPLWDASRSRWLSGCFLWSIEPTRILTKQTDMAFLTAFGNSIMAEWARIDTEIADQKKSDFIGSISHELRSPLHGILAAVEFLQDLRLPAQAQEWIGIIDSCARTLLDTINHLLDYSKINHFERNWRRTKRNNHRRQNSTGVRSDLPMLNIYQNLDVTVLCEEVINSVFAGHVFQSITTQNFDVVPGTRGKMSDVHGTSTPKIQSPSVAVILDIESRSSPQFNTQPGALRRLIMNLLGNALKYTSRGYVHVKLQVSDAEIPSTSSVIVGEHVPRSMVTLTVTDTGKGISPEFLRSKLFTPFAQENSLSSGTGLGLSIVRKIISLLEGDIRMDSEVGRGTKVIVTLPLMRETPKTTDSMSSASTKSVTVSTYDADQSVSELRGRVMGQTVSLLGFDIGPHDPVVREMGRLLKSAVQNYLTSWFGLSIVPLGSPCDIVVCNENDHASIRTMVRAIRGNKPDPSVVILCAHDTRFDQTPRIDGTTCNISYVAKPVGPLKLAKAIICALDGVPPSTTPGIDSSMSPAEKNDLSSTFDSLTLSPHGGEVLDNTRMSADSENARKAIESPTPNATIEKGVEFPFPHPLSNVVKRDENPSQASGNNPSDLITAQYKISKKKKTETAKKPSPTFLLVDDNTINMKVLSTKVNQYNFEIVHEAKDGLEAVHKFEARRNGYDIIFMDISMPVLDGFGATNQIRAIEANRARKYIEIERQEGSLEDNLIAADMSLTKPKPALIIAFTGLSSMEDQNESARVGIDLFMTKPVPLSEVGKIIENWMANGEK